MKANLIVFDPNAEAKHANNGGSLAADFWKGQVVDVVLQTWTKKLDDGTETNRAKGGDGMLGCWLVDDANNRGWANLSHLGSLMSKSLNATDKKLFFQKKNNVEYIMLDTPAKITIEMDEGKRPTIIKVSVPK